MQFINKIQQDATMYQKFVIAYLYESQHVSGDTPPNIGSLKLYWQPMFFYMWQVVWTCSWWTCQAQCAWHDHQLYVQTTYHVWKTRGYQCSLRLLMMGGVSPETCWASYKYGKTKFWYIVSSCILFMNLWRLHVPDAVYFACSDVTETSEHDIGEVMCPPHQWPRHPPCLWHPSETERSQKYCEMKVGTNVQ